jgi:urease accessory protein
MSVAILRYEAPAPVAQSPAATLERGRGAAEIVFDRRRGATQLVHLMQRAPCRVLFPDAEAGDPKLAVLLTTSGGLTGGDEIRISATLRAGAAATLTSQAAEKLYRSLGPNTEVTVVLAVEEGARLEYLPQETILFDGARLCRRTSAAVAPGGRLLACEMLVFGRKAHDESFACGRLYDSWRVTRGGRLVWADAQALEGDIAARLGDPFGFAGAEALATALYVGDDAGSHLALAREHAETSACRGGATLLGNVLLARFFGAPATAVGADLARYLAALRHAALDHPARLPRVWHS